MPKNTGTGFVLGALSTVLGFALVWYIWWLAAVSLLAILAVAIIHTFNYDRDGIFPEADVARFESLRTAQLSRGNVS